MIRVRTLSVIDSRKPLMTHAVRRRAYSRKLRP